VVVPKWGKLMLFVALPVGGAIAAYQYLVHVLQPVPSATACLLPINGWQCRSYEAIVSAPSFIVFGALFGAWFAYGLIRLYAQPRCRSFTWLEGFIVAPVVIGLTAWIVALHPGFTWIDWGTLSWDEVLLLIGAAVAIRVAIAIASLANARGGLVLALGLPIVCAFLGRTFIDAFRAPPVGHSCIRSGADCVFHPLIGQTSPWMILGVLVGLWLAFGLALDIARSPRPGLFLLEAAVVVPAGVALIYWARVVGPDQAGSGDVGKFILAVVVAALVRLLLALGPTKRLISSVTTRAGVTTRTKQDGASSAGVLAS
jgi:hypothetical protein